MFEGDFVSSGYGLLSLPVEVLLVIGELLSPQDLLAASATCRHLRSVFNDNSLWRKYTKGGVVSGGLNSSASLVIPTYQDPCTTNLETLCEHRLHFLKQSRLLSNVRRGNFVKHSIEFYGSLSEFETMKPLDNRQITYSSKFLFAVNYDRDDEVICIFDIEISPKLLLTVKLENHSTSYCIITWVQVVGSKLVVRRDGWFDIYDIKLPESLELLYSINIDGLGIQQINKTLILGKHLFVENLSKNVITIWDISSGDRYNDLCPKINGANFTILGFSQDEMFVILSVGMVMSEGSDPNVFVYNIKSQDYLPFKPILNKADFKCIECYGLINSDCVVLLNERNNLKFSVFVFDCSKSTLIAVKSNLVTRRIEDAKIIDRYLVLPSFVSVLIMTLRSLETVWEIQLNTTQSLFYDFPRISMLIVDVLHFSNLTSIIGAHNASGIEMWDFNTRTQVLKLPEKHVVWGWNDNYTKLLISDLENLTVFSYW